MFSKELESLIQATLEDGKLEDYEKGALQKRAQAEGVDLTELEIYINSILQKRKKELEKEYAALEKQKKEEFGKVCPACGRQVPSLALNCECGYEFKKDRHESSVQVLSDKLSQLQEKYRGKNDDDMDDMKELNERIIETITMFPVPNTKEDIVDFLALAAPNSRKKGGLWGTISGRLKLLAGLIGIICFFVLIYGITGYDGEEDIGGILASTLMMVSVGGGMVIFNTDRETLLYNKRADAWRAKFEQALMKGHSLRADAEFIHTLDYYEKQVKQSESESGLSEFARKLDYLIKQVGK